MCLIVNVTLLLQVFTVLLQIKEATGATVLEVFETAMVKITCVLEVRARRVGGSNYQVPVEEFVYRVVPHLDFVVVTISRLRGVHTIQDRVLQKKSWMLLTTLVAVKKREEILTVSEALTVHSHTSVGKIGCESVKKITEKIGNRSVLRLQHLRFIFFSRLSLSSTKS